MMPHREWKSLRDRLDFGALNRQDITKVIKEAQSLRCENLRLRKYIRDLKRKAQGNE